MAELSSKQDMTIQLIANSGVLVTCGPLRVLVDGVYGRSRYFSPPRREMELAAAGEPSVYRDADALLVTHRHGDHFDAAAVDAYAAHNRTAVVCVPRASGDPQSYFEDQRPLPQAAERGVLYEVCPEGAEQAVISLGAGARAEYLRTQHLDWKVYSSIVHCSLVLEAGGRRVLFAADADRSPENRERLSALGRLDAVFVTPLFFSYPSGRQCLEAMGAERVALYHIPFAPDDSSGLRRMAADQLARTYPFPLTALMEPGDQLALPAGTMDREEGN